MATRVLVETSIWSHTDKSKTQSVKGKLSLKGGGIRNAIGRLMRLTPFQKESCSGVYKSCDLVA